MRRLLPFTLILGGCLGPVHTLTTSSSGGSGTGGGGSGTGAASSTSGTNVSATSGAMTSSSTGIDPVPPNPCAPTEGMSIADTCGVFVDAKAAPNGNGSQPMPFASILDAAKNIPASKSAIYVCGSDIFSQGSITLRAGVSLYGGYDCTDWRFSVGNPPPTLVGSADAAAVTIADAGMENFASINIRAADAKQPGGSSIAILVNGGEIDATRIQVMAGVGQAGAAGADASQAPPPQAQQGTMGGEAFSSCQTSSNLPPTPGAPALMFSCPNGTGTSVGGKGGDGQVFSGTNGDPGMTGSSGQGGKGYNGSSWTCGSLGIGQTGSSGAPGAVGVAGAEGTIGLQGYSPGVAGSGGPGAAAQGGGGAGGSEGTPRAGCGIGYYQAGPSGGSGGGGGCGGDAGSGGAGGGSSFGIVALSAKVVLVRSIISTSAGGAGGTGGASQPGGAGGAGGHGGYNQAGGNGCDGGAGGTGGNGGGGGGGHGGHSAPIVFIGNLPQMVDSATTLSKGTAGMGGAGVGNGAIPGNNGTPGFACSILDLDPTIDKCLAP